MPEGRLAHSPLAERALMREAQRLFDSGEVESLVDGLRRACSTMDGAGNKRGETVESVQTCTDLFGEKVPGLTAPDTITPRTDKLARSETARRRRAEAGKDEAARWLRGKK